MPHRVQLVVQLAFCCHSDSRSSSSVGCLSCPLFRCVFLLLPSSLAFAAAPSGCTAILVIPKYINGRHHPNATRVVAIGRLGGTRYGGLSADCCSLTVRSRYLYRTGTHTLSRLHIQQTLSLLFCCCKLSSPSPKQSPAQGLSNIHIHINHVQPANPFRAF